MKLISKIVITCLIVSFPMMAQAQENEFLLGKAAFDKKDYQQAISYLSIHLANNPKYDKARLLRIESYLAIANFSKAIEDLWALKNSKNDEFLLLKARTYAGLGDVKNAIENLNLYRLTNNKVAEEIIKAFPEFSVLKNSTEWKNLWQNWKYTEKESALIDIKYALKSERKGEAIDRLDQFLFKYKSSAEAYYLRGNLYFAGTDYKNALDCYESAINIDNTNSNYFLARALANLRLKKERKALEDYTLIIEKDSLMLEAFLGRAEAFFALLDFQRALDDVSKFRKYYPDNQEALFVEAKINVKLGDFLSAIGEYGKLIRTNPGNPQYFISRADAYSETKTYIYAIKDYSMALDLDPLNVEVYKKKAKAYQLSGNIKSACIEWQHAVRLGDIESMNNIQRYCKN